MSSSMWHIYLLVFCVITSVTSHIIGEKAEKDLETEKTPEKRSGRGCIVRGRYYRHGALFTIPEVSSCIKYRCYNGGYRIVQKGCGLDGGCVPVGSTRRSGCRSYRCTEERRDRVYYFRLVPTEQDMCESEGRCFLENVPFNTSVCQTYVCVKTRGGGFRLRAVGEQGCKDHNNRCVDVGSRFAAIVDGRLYRDCECLSGGSYRCCG